jgi:hypothetical protein
MIENGCDFVKKYEMMIINCNRGLSYELLCDLNFTSNIMLILF